MIDNVFESIAIHPLEKLMIHEEIIPYNLEHLKESMVRSGRLVDPIIIDKESKIILDGNHRKRALDMLKCRYAPCQEVNYQDEGIKIGSWFPMMDSLSLLGNVRVEKVDYDTGLQELERMRACFMAVSKKNNRKECGLIGEGCEDVRVLIREQNNLLKGVNSSIEYIANDVCEDYLNAGKTVLYRRIIKKEEVVREASAGNAFPPKSTRHIIPKRILHLNVPLAWLFIEPKEAMHEIKKMIEECRNENRVRLYRESVVVLYW